eukprot:352573-Chlamydomonas_euryale.AAC.2
MAAEEADMAAGEADMAAREVAGQQGKLTGRRGRGACRGGRTLPPLAGERCCVVRAAVCSSACNAGLPRTRHGINVCEGEAVWNECVRRGSGMESGCVKGKRYGISVFVKEKRQCGAQLGLFHVQ